MRPYLLLFHIIPFVCFFRLVLKFFRLVLKFFAALRLFALLRYFLFTFVLTRTGKRAKIKRTVEQSFNQKPKKEGKNEKA